MTRDLDRRVVRLETTRRNRRTLADWTDGELFNLLLTYGRTAIAQGSAEMNAFRDDCRELPDVLDALGLSPIEQDHSHVPTH